MAGAGGWEGAEEEVEASSEGREEVEEDADEMSLVRLLSG